MQATLDAFSLKPFTKALTCLSKYGDELVIYATTDTFLLSATNSSMSAYCRFKYGRQFFSKYSVGTLQPEPTLTPEDDREVSTVTGQLLTKSLLSILKHRTIEKTVDRCELSVAEGTQTARQEEDQDGLESKLIVRLHCKHGVVKTHRLVLMTPTSLMAPGVPDALNESRLKIGPKAIRDITEYFPPARGAKSDPQLVWNFGDTQVDVKSLESSADTKGRIQLSTELTISVEEFDEYNVYSPPITISFHLREFSATIAYSEAMSLPLDIRFTDPAAPLFIDVEGDSSEALFVISTSQVQGTATGTTPSNQTRQLQVNNKKREHDDANVETTRVKKPMRVVQRADAAEVEPRSRSRAETSIPPPSSPTSSRTSSQDVRKGPRINSPVNPSTSHVQLPREPLFLPGSTQLSAADEEAIRASGLGIENMDAEEFNAMFEEEGDEVQFDFALQSPGNVDRNVLHRWRGDGDSVGNGNTTREEEAETDTFQFDDEMLASTQRSQNFEPLFDD